LSHSHQTQNWRAFDEALSSHVKARKPDEEWQALEAREYQRVAVEDIFTDALHPLNRPKNRYRDIIPYNATRVKLSSLPGVEASDYINACIVKMNHGEYIAAQAPLPHTFFDFYRMIWEQKSTVVLMLTRCEEMGKLKAHNYLPEVQQSLDVGDIRVTLIEDPHVAEHYVIRRLRLDRGSEFRMVVHYHYIAWPDHGLPKPETFLEMRAAVLQQQAGESFAGPEIVHCSAGVGRTGTWIAISTLLAGINEAATRNILPAVNVMQTLEDMRSQKAGMIQTFEQYTFVYDSVITHLRLQFE